MSSATRSATTCSARDRQRERMKMGQPYAYAKNLATFCPMGPWIVTAKELGDPRTLKMDVRINRQGDPQRLFRRHDLRSVRGAGLLFRLYADGARRHHRARHLFGRQADRCGRSRRTRRRADRYVAQPRRAVKREVVQNFAAGTPTGPLVRSAKASISWYSCHSGVARSCRPGIHWSAPAQFWSPGSQPDAPRRSMLYQSS